MGLLGFANAELTPHLVEGDEEKGDAEPPALGGASRRRNEASGATDPPRA